MGNEQQAGQYGQYRSEGRSFSAPRTIIGGGQWSANDGGDEAELRRQHSGLTGYQYLKDETGRYNVEGGANTAVIGGSSGAGGVWSNSYANDGLAIGSANNVAMARGQAQVIGGGVGGQGAFVTSGAGNFGQASGSAQVIGGRQVGGASGAGGYQSSFATGGTDNFAKASGNAMVLEGGSTGMRISGGNYSTSANYSNNRQVGGGAGFGSSAQAGHAYGSNTGGATYHTTTSIFQNDSHAKASGNAMVINDGHAKASGNAMVLNDGGATFQSSTRRVEGGNGGYMSTGITTMNKKIFDDSANVAVARGGNAGGYSNTVTMSSGRMIDGRASHQGDFGSGAAGGYTQSSRRVMGFEGGQGGANTYNQSYTQTSNRVVQGTGGINVAQRLSDEELGDYRPYVTKGLGSTVATSNVAKARGQAAVLDPGFQTSTRSIFADPAPKTINTGMYTSHRRSLSSDRRVQGGSQSAIFTGSGANVGMQKIITDGNVPKAIGQASVIVDSHYGGRTSETFARTQQVTSDSYQRNLAPVIDKAEIKRDLEVVKNKVKSAFQPSSQDIVSSRDFQNNNAAISASNIGRGYQTNQYVTSQTNLVTNPALNQSGMSGSNFYNTAITTSKVGKMQTQKRVSDDQYAEPAITKAPEEFRENKVTSSIYLKDQASRQTTEFVPKQVGHIQQARVVEGGSQFGAQTGQVTTQYQTGEPQGKVSQIETHTVTHTVDGNTSYSEIRQNIKYEDGTQREYQKVTEVRPGMANLGSATGAMIGGAAQAHSLVQQANVQTVSQESRPVTFGGNDIQTSQYVSNIQTSQIRPPSRHYIPIESSNINDRNYTSAIKMERFRAREGISPEKLRASSQRINLPAGETGLGINLRDIKSTGVVTQSGQYGLTSGSAAYNAQLGDGAYNMSAGSVRNYNVNLGSLNSGLQGGSLNYDGRVNAPNLRVDGGNLDLAGKKNDLEFTLGSYNPKLGQVRGNVDGGFGGNLNAPNADMNFGRVGYDINAPQANLNVPKVNADFNAPKFNTDINMPNANYNLSGVNANYNLPNANANYNLSGVNANYNLPNANINAPSVNVKAPEVEAGFGSKLKSGITGIGAGIGAGFGALGAKMGLSKPDVDAKLTAPSIEAPRIQGDFKAPNLNTDFNAPNARVGFPDVNANIGDFRSDFNAKVGNLKADINAPNLNADWNAPKVNTDFKAPNLNADWNAPKLNADINAPKFNSEWNAPKLNADWNAPKFNTDINLPKGDLNMPKVNADWNMPKADLNMPKFGGDVNLPKADLNMPKMNADWNMPKADLNMPKFNTDVNLPKADWNMPKADLSMPKFNSDFNAPRINADINAPKLDYNLPNANANYNLSGANANYNLPNANINAPSVNVKAPEVEAGFGSKLKSGITGIGAGIGAGFGALGAKMGLSKPDVDAKLTAPSIEAPRIQGDFKAPNLNTDFNAPKINTDFNAPKLNTDWNAPKLNADWNAPKLNTDFNAPKLNADWNTPNLKANLPDVNANLGTYKSDFNANLGNFKSDLNANIGNLKADINAPKFNTDFNAPKLNTDINAPKLNADFNAPNMKASFPDVNANLGNLRSDINASLPSYDAKWNAPSASYKTDLNLPNVNSEWNAPKFGADLPSANFNKNLNLDVNAPNYKLTAPDANYHLDINSLNGELRAPDARIGALRSGANIGLDAPNVHTSGLNINAPSYNAQGQLPNMNMEYGSNTRGSLKIGEIRSGANINQAFGTFDANAPNVSLKTGNVDLAGRTHDSRLAGGNVQIDSAQNQFKLNTEGLNANYNVDLSLQKKNTNDIIANMTPPVYSTDLNAKAPTASLRAPNLQGEIKTGDGFGFNTGGANLNANAGQYNTSGAFAGMKNGVEIGSNYHINTQGQTIGLGGQQTVMEFNSKYDGSSSAIGGGQTGLQFNTGTGAGAGAGLSSRDVAYGEYRVGGGSAQKIAGAQTTGHYLDKAMISGGHKEAQSGGFFDTLKEKIFGSSKTINHIDQNRETFRQGQSKLVVPGQFTYEGNFVNNQFHGRGNIKYNDGSIFIGEFKNNKREGPGKLYDPIGNLVREGLWIDDQPHS